MVCDECNQNKATFHSLRIINGMARERHLCAACQSKSSEAAATASPLLNGLFNNFAAFSGTLDAAPRQKVVTCPRCGVTSVEVLKTGLLGCANCYSAFLDMLLPLIQKVQSGTQHKGKSPIQDGALTHVELARLKEELDTAVSAQDYAKAAAIQAKIKAIQSEGVQ